jgi:hypothetical protein
VIALTENRCGGDCACGVEPLAHPKYSFGMLLEARHLALEHRYGAMRMNAHDVRLHGFGTVCGLAVVRHPSKECVNEYVILEPGIALDCCGREIVVPEKLFVPLRAGATSGWCGAPCGTSQAALPPSSATASGSSTSNTSDATKRTTLYVSLRYRECDTDPIPTYVRSCGCCGGDCEHGDCVPSVTREGYEIVVTDEAPRKGTADPVATAFCRWLDAKLNAESDATASQPTATAAPGASATKATSTTAEPVVVQPGTSRVDLQPLTLQQTLVDVLTKACADPCADGDDALPLATIVFGDDDTLSSIDNASGRRIVLSTTALFGAIECLTAAAERCCKRHAYVDLSASVEPATVRLGARLSRKPASGNTLTYTLVATNTDPSATADAFALSLAFPTGLVFGSATLTLGTTKSTPNGTATGVDAPVQSLDAGASATLTVTATFDLSAYTSGDSLIATASISSYDGAHGAPVTLRTSFTGDDLVDVPVNEPQPVVEQPGTAATPPQPKQPRGAAPPQKPS